MKASKPVVTSLISLCMALYIYTFIALPCNCDNNILPDKNISYLHTQNDSLRKSNQLLDKQLQAFSFQSDSLRQMLLEKKQTINNLKNKQNEKIIRLDSLNSRELFSFFSKFNP